MQACSDRRRVRLDYRSEAGSEWVAEVDPWAVVVRHGRWYLLCRSHAADARRAYRIDRVRGVEVLDDTFTPPADLDPVALLEEHLAVGWEYDVEVVIDAPLDAVARCAAPRARPARAGRRRRPPGWSAAPATRGGTPSSSRRSRRRTGSWACPELQETARVVGQRLLAAAGDATADEPGS